MTTSSSTALADERSPAWSMPSLILTLKHEPPAGNRGRNLFVSSVGLGTSSCETEAIDEGLRVIARLAELLGGGVVVASMFLAEPCGGALPTKPMVLPAQIGRGGYGISVVGRF